MKTIYLAGGCFWGLEAYLKRLSGVQATIVGYANGLTAAPTYQQVCAGHTKHAETVCVRYDEREIPLEILLEAFFAVIDPLSVDRQGNDCGHQYRSGIYYTDLADKPIIDRVVWQQSMKQQQPLATEVLPLENFSPAEAEHQDYLAKNPASYCHIDLGQAQPFIKRLQARTSLIKQNYVKPPQKQLRTQLDDLTYAVTQEAATEPPYCNTYHDHFARGIYVDAVTGEPLFLSCDKFSSGCGWPSFSRPIMPEAVWERDDDSHHMHRTEVLSRYGQSHLGHLFEDGPSDLGGLRYCINSAALRFVPYEAMAEAGYGDLMILLEE